MYTKKRVEANGMSACSEVPRPAPSIRSDAANRNFTKTHAGVDYLGDMSGESRRVAHFVPALILLRFCGR